MQLGYFFSNGNQGEGQTYQPFLEHFWFCLVLFLSRRKKGFSGEQESACVATLFCETAKDAQHRGILLVHACELMVSAFCIGSIKIMWMLLFSAHEKV